MSTSQVFHPEVLWAQRANELYVTINLVDIKDPKINVTTNKISFEGIGGTEQKLYGFELELNKEINPETSKRSQTGRNIILVLNKAENCQGYWPRLQKEKGKVTFLKTDFSKWKDEDEDDEEGGGGGDPLGGMDFSNLMGGDSGSGADLSDSDDDEPPALETVTDETRLNEPKEDEFKEGDGKGSASETVQKGESGKEVNEESKE
ncbi:794_t:CDS:2 [Diversispora eburnea]|uniref:794_t:CDS:1 n=1 Tax=Diversispora eburnea TaxID=1213867 RepID=A0A9N8VJE4_9GLOM|nr:794_t:CDS:2 [Diversispora eburnea]